MTDESQITKIEGLKISYSNLTYNKFINKLTISGMNMYIELMYFNDSKFMKGTMIYNERMYYVSFPVINNIEKNIEIKNTVVNTIPVNPITILKKHEKVVDLIQEFNSDEKVEK